MKLLTITQAADYLGLGTVIAARKLLEKLNVPKYNMALVGGKGLRYRVCDIDAGLERIRVEKKKHRERKKNPSPTLFDLPIKEQIATLCCGGNGVVQ